jgi:hypothetical protein
MSTTPQALPPPAVGQSWLEHPLATIENYVAEGELCADQIDHRDTSIVNLMRRDWNIYNKTKIHQWGNR